MKIENEKLSVFSEKGRRLREYGGCRSTTTPYGGTLSLRQGGGDTILGVA